MFESRMEEFFRSTDFFSNSMREKKINKFLCQIMRQKLITGMKSCFESKPIIYLLSNNFLGIKTFPE